MTFRTVSLIAFLGMAAGISIYHLLLRSRYISNEPEPRTVHRFTFQERCLHWTAVFSLVVLAVTGFFSVVVLGNVLRGWLWMVHYLAAPVFAVAVAGIALIWSEDSRFKGHDLVWLQHLGGYLWKKDRLPAGRFNAGQKIFFWCVGMLTAGVIASGVGRLFPAIGPSLHETCYQIHRYGALALVLLIIGHLYLGSLANPGTLGAMITGRVGSGWASHHHSLWLKSIVEGGKESHDK